MLMAASQSVAFNELAREAALTPGNLQSHLKSLEAAGYVEAWRSIVELKPRMRYRLTASGVAALRTYCDQLRATVQSIQSVTDMARSKEPDAGRG